MELTSSALTAALVGIILALIKVIEWFTGRQNNNNKTKAAQDFNGHGEVLTKIEAKIDVLASSVQEMRQSRTQIIEHMAAASSSQERVIDRLDSVVTSVDRLTDSILRKDTKNG